MNINLGAAGREFDMIRELMRSWGALAEGNGSDCATLQLPDAARMIVSTDTTVEGIHFRREWMSPREVGYRAVASAMSDLAAAAAEPIAVLLALNVPSAWEESIVELGHGAGDAVKAAGPHARIVGGDTSRAAEFSLTVTVIGAATRPLTRAGASAGDHVFVTGELGRSRRALEVLLAGLSPSADDRDRFVRPVPRLREAKWLAENGATAAIDISDGLLSELKHMAAANDSRLVIDVDRVNATAGVDLTFAMSSGEEYELLVTAPAGIPTEAFERLFAMPLSDIGRVESGAPTVELRSHGKLIELPERGGHSHF